MSNKITIETLFEREAGLRIAASEYGKSPTTTTARKLRTAARLYSETADLFEQALDSAAERSAATTETGQ